MRPGQPTRRSILRMGRAAHFAAFSGFISLTRVNATAGSAIAVVEADGAPLEMEPAPEEK